MSYIFNLLLGGIIALLGLFFAIAGAKLALLGGSLYYLIAGLILLGSGFFTIRQHAVGRWLFMLVWIGTALWSVWEAGFNIYPLIPRLGLLTGLLLPIIILEFADHHASKTPSRLVLTATGSVAAVGLFILTFAGGTKPDALTIPEITPPSEAVPTNEADNNWHDYGGTPSGRHYSSLADITPANIGALKLAWVQHKGDISSPAEVSAPTRKIYSEATPIHIGHTLYNCTADNSLQAIDDTSGKTLWTWEDTSSHIGKPHLICRGVSYYEAPQGAPCPHRLFAPTIDAHIVALNAEDGTLCTHFGENGYVDLRANMAESTIAAPYVSASPPTLLNNRLIIGERVDDRIKQPNHTSIIRAYDAVSGALIWAWDVGRSPNAIPPLPTGQTYTQDTPSISGTITADTANGIIFMRTGKAPPNYQRGMLRSVNDEFSSSIIALDVGTGRLIWHRQLVHHDMWDMGTPDGPSLFDYKTPDGTIIPALVQTTKIGQVYFLNRLRGEPISPIREIPIPTNGAIEGVTPSPTQPFSVGMPNLTLAPPREDTSWGVTPIDQLLCRIDLRHMQGAGPFQPIGTKPVIGLPAFKDIANGNSAAIDPERGIMTINMMDLPFKIWLTKRDNPEAQRLLQQRHAGESATNALTISQDDTAYIRIATAWLGIFGAPCLQPPWGRIAAIDLHTRKLLWQKPHGTHWSLPLKIGTANNEGSIITAGGVVFIGATTDQYIRALDLQTGKEIWKHQLPAGTQAPPMTYRGQDGRQYIVITAGRNDTYAFALSKTTH